MKISLEIVPRPMVTSFTMFAKPSISLLKEKKEVIIDTHLISKTRVSTSIQIGEACNKVNFAIEGFKTFEKTEMNYFSGGSSTSNYFVLSKKQNREAYIEYVKKVVEKCIVEYFGVEMESVNILLREPRF